MRVKVGSKWLSSDDMDLCVEFTETELEQVKAIDPEIAPNRRFAVMNAGGRAPDEMRAWIRECDDASGE